MTVWGLQGRYAGKNHSQGLGKTGIFKAIRLSSTAFPVGSMTSFVKSAVFRVRFTVNLKRNATKPSRSATNPPGFAVKLLRPAAFLKSFVPFLKRNAANRVRFIMKLIPVVRAMVMRKAGAR